MSNQVAILAGGMGTRLSARSGGLPKPMVPVLGKPVLEHQISLCKAHGFSHIALLLHHQSDAIQAYFGDGAPWGVELTYVIETDARGTAGALRDALDHLDEQFLVLYADTYADIDLGKMWRSAVASDAAGTLLLHPNDHPHDSDLVEIVGDGTIAAIRPYPHPEASCYPNLVNAALYVLRKAHLVDLIPAQGKHDLAKDTFKAMLSRGLALNAYITPEYIKDMGTPARLDKVEGDLIRGVPERLSARNRRLAVFLDRDGTLNEEVNYLASADQLVLLPGVCEAVHRLNRAGVLAVSVTNQPVLARGDVTWEGMQLIHARLDQLLGNGHAYLDRLYLCPHHPDQGFPGEVPELKMVCDCRKPAPGLLDQAVKELEIDRRQSWMVGDTTGDILAGQRAGVRTILLRTGHAGRDHKHPVQADYVCDDLPTAVDWILNGHGQLTRKLMPIVADNGSMRLMLLGGPSRVGKSMAAQVLKELMQATGRTPHIIPLDAWLKPAGLRLEGTGVLGRYDMALALESLLPLLGTAGRATLNLPVWDRKTSTQVSSRLLSIGPEDLLIVEGVPALLDPELRRLTESSIHLDTARDVRQRRVHWEYQWRGEQDEDIAKRIASREQDEVAQVQEAASHAKYMINL
ncbi:HAD-IIIA family hydrolase [Aquabacterium sp.]|uniref:HAD-IIIA family hydrolase n=1 Tax=Aquabacterium sp. TaxID=1872578 RepID=UPI00198EB62E|nr:HAD-IIIA family hydrolase [Aquabacterium sp.]MBC7700867.1 HAD-IIIA family hydrolase [Aquabacterium sp.]